MPDYRVNAVRDALTILSLFDYFHPTHTLTSLSEESRIQKSKVLRLLFTLEELGFVDRGANGRYALGAAAKRLSRVGGIYGDVQRIVQETLTTLRDEWLETVNFGLIRGNKLVYAAILDSPHPFRVVENVGDVVPMTITAMGRAILALHPTPEIFCSTKELTDLEPFVTTVRDCGYAIDDEEVENGVRCVGIPVRDGDGVIIGGLSVTGPAIRLSMDRLEIIGRGLQAVGEEMYQKLKSITTQV